jgi:hypothetical protein
MKEEIATGEQTIVARRQELTDLRRQMEEARGEATTARETVSRPPRSSHLEEQSFPRLSLASSKRVMRKHPLGAGAPDEGAG